VNEVWLLLGLLVLAFLGSILVGGRAIRGFGLTSGAEYLVLGFVLGPHVLDIVGPSLVQTFEPVVIVGIGWLALVIGLSYFRVGTRRIRFGRRLLGIVMSLLATAGVAAAVFFMARRFTGLSKAELYFVSAACGLVSAESTRHTVRWVVERLGARGEMSDLAADLARASSLIPACLLAGLFAFAPEQTLTIVPGWGRVLLTFGLGIVLGLIAALLLGRDFRRDESWGILLGTSLLAMGAAVSLGLSPLATMFAMGLTLAASRHGHEIKAMVTPTEKPVFLPATLLAGVYVNTSLPRELLGLVVVALTVKIAVRVLLGLLLSAGSKVARPAGIELGMSMLSSGALSLAIAFAIARRVPGPIGDAVLLLAAAATVLGEFVGPAMLRRALSRADELHAVDPAFEAVPESERVPRSIRSSEA